MFRGTLQKCILLYTVHEYSKCQNNKKMPGNSWELGRKASKTAVNVGEGLYIVYFETM